MVIRDRPAERQAREREPAFCLPEDFSVEDAVAAIKQAKPLSRLHTQNASNVIGGFIAERQ